jgi:hypothetical protein
VSTQTSMYEDELHWAAQIEFYWRGRGHSVDVRVVRHQGRIGNGSRQVIGWGITSNLVNGMPMNKAPGL